MTARRFQMGVVPEAGDKGLKGVLSKSRSLDFARDDTSGITRFFRRLSCRACRGISPKALLGFGQQPLNVESLKVRGMEPRHLNVESPAFPPPSFDFRSSDVRPCPSATGNPGTDSAGIAPVVSRGSFLALAALLVFAGVPLSLPAQEEGTGSSGTEHMLKWSAERCREELDRVDARLAKLPDEWKELAAEMARVRTSVMDEDPKAQELKRELDALQAKVESKKKELAARVGESEQMKGLESRKQALRNEWRDAARQRQTLRVRLQALGEK